LVRKTLVLLLLVVVLLSLSLTGCQENLAGLATSYASPQEAFDDSIAVLDELYDRAQIEEAGVLADVYRHLPPAYLDDVDSYSSYLEKNKVKQLYVDISLAVGNVQTTRIASQMPAPARSLKVITLFQSVMNKELKNYLGKISGDLPDQKSKSALASGTPKPVSVRSLPGADTTKIVDSSSSRGMYVISGQVYDSDLNGYENINIIDSETGVLYAVTNHEGKYNFEKNSFSSFEQLDKLTATNPSLSDFFGWSVSLDETTFFVGSPNYILPEAYGEGEVHIFEKQGSIWEESQVLTAEDGFIGNMFGSKVKLDNNIAFVSAYHDNEFGESSGAVYVFEKQGQTWIQTQKITSSDASMLASFGYALAYNGEFLFVSSKKGKIYIFENQDDSWVEFDVINKGGMNNYFGWSISVFEDTLIVHDDTTMYIYEFDGNSWDLKNYFDVESSPNGKVFISDSVIVYGAHEESVTGSDSGAVYIFEKQGQTWIQTQKLVASDSTSFQHFGYAIYLEEHTLFIGAPGELCSGEGAVYVFVFDGEEWIESATFTANDVNSCSNFGSSFEKNSDNLIVGARYDNELGEETGSVYIFSFEYFSTKAVDPSGNIIPLKTTGDTNQYNYFNLVGDVSNKDFKSIEFVPLSGEYYSISGYVMDPNLNGYDNVNITDVDTGEVYATSDSAGYYAFEANTVVEHELVQELFPDPGFSSIFGSDISVNENVLFAGAPGDAEAGTNAGAVYVYSFDGSSWVREQKLTVNNINNSTKIDTT
jgi:hypothetical protein